MYALEGLVIFDEGTYLTLPSSDHMVFGRWQFGLHADQ